MNTGIYFAILFALAVAAYVLYDLYLKPPPPAPRTTFGDARWADPTNTLDHAALKPLFVPKGIFLGLLSWRVGTGRDRSNKTFPLHYDGPRHVVTVAPNRSGKGTCAIIPNLLTLEHSVIIIDPKGENAAVTARRRRELGTVHLLNPFNEHALGTSRLNPLAHLTIDSPNVVADVASLAEALIVSDGKETHWTDSARSLVKLLMLHLVATKGGDATLIEMRRLLTQGVEGFGSMILDMMESPHAFIAQPAAQFETNSKEVQSIISTARTQTAFLDDPAIARVLAGSDFTMLDLKARPTTVYIILPSRFLVAYARFFRLLVVAAIDQLQSRPGGVKTTLMIDEFAALGHLSAVETAFGQAAGFNVQLWPFLQDLNQLKSIYTDRWETFLANAGVIQWFAPNDMFTADYISRRLGQMTVTTRGTSISQQNSGDRSSSSESTGEAGLPFQSAQDIMSISGASAVLSLAGFRYGIDVVRWPYYFGIGHNNPETAAHYAKQKADLKMNKGDQKNLDDMLEFYSRYNGHYDRNPFHG